MALRPRRPGADPGERLPAEARHVVLSRACSAEVEARSAGRTPDVTTCRPTTRWPPAGTSTAQSGRCRSPQKRPGTSSPVRPDDRRSASCPGRRSAGRASRGGVAPGAAPARIWSISAHARDGPPARRESERCHPASSSRLQCRMARDFGARCSGELVHVRDGGGGFGAGRWPAPAAGGHRRDQGDAFSTVRPLGVTDPGDQRDRADVGVLRGSPEALTDLA